MKKTFRKHREMIKGIEFAMLTTVEDDGNLLSRPLATQRNEFDGDLYFFTKVRASKVGEIERDRNVCVSYAAPEDQRYVSMSGRHVFCATAQRWKSFGFPILKHGFVAA